MQIIVDTLPYNEALLELAWYLCGQVMGFSGADVEPSWTTIIATRNISPLKFKFHIHFKRSSLMLLLLLMLKFQIFTYLMDFPSWHYDVLVDNETFVLKKKFLIFWQEIRSQIFWA